MLIQFRLSYNSINKTKQHRMSDLKRHPVVKPCVFVCNSRRLKFTCSGTIYDNAYDLVTASCHETCYNDKYLISFHYEDDLKSVQLTFSSRSKEYSYLSCLSNKHLQTPYQPRHEKTCLRGLRPE